MEFQGIVAPMLTPTTGRTGSVDTEALSKLTERLDGTVHGVFPCGTTGEFASLSHRQRATAIETVANAADETPVLAGCCGSSIEGVREQIEAAAAAGADAAVVVTPYYFDADDDGLVEFFAAAADASPLPVILYSIPVLTDVRPSVEGVVTLAEHDRIVGIKATSPDQAYVRSLVRRTPASFRVLQGSTVHGLASLDIGADGVVSGEANVIPDAVADFYLEHRAGNRDRAVEVLRDEILPLSEVIGDMPVVPAIKHLVELTGIEAGPPLPPLPELTAEQKRTLAELADEQGLRA